MSGSTSTRPISLENADEYIARKNRQSKIPWIATSQLVISGLQLVALIYFVSRWDKFSNSFPKIESPKPTAVSHEIDQSLVKGWHETLTLLKASDEANAKLRDQIIQLEQRLAAVEAPKTELPAPTLPPLAEKDGKLHEKAKE